ncbi:hypothetical protein A3768_4905 (plasmid) [Ralstonia solanacearum]|nr:hypothetical protein A3768_4905 [Ralstonia solanacearum]
MVEFCGKLPDRDQWIGPDGAGSAILITRDANADNAMRLGG